MAADFNLTNQYISASFDNLMQDSGSIPVNGLGTQINNLTVTSSYATTASYALNSEAQVSASYANRAGVADAVSGSNVVGNVATASFALTAASVTGTITSASYAISSSQAELAKNATNATSASHAIIANSALTATSASHALASNTSISASHALQSNNATTATTATTASYVTTAQTASYVAAANIDGTVATATSASHALRADISDNVASTARLNVTDITASNATFTSASIGYLKTVTGSATIIGDEYIILNADSPTKRFAGIKVYDSGSGLTGSFEWDSIDDNWIQVETGGTSAGMLTGISGSKGSEAYPSNNTILKGTGNHTVQNSIITDNGSTVTVAGIVSASTFFGDGSGLTNIFPASSSYAISASHAVNANTATSASFATTASFALNTNVDSGSWDGQFTGDASITGSLIVSRSSGQALTSDGNFTANLFTPSAFTEHQILTAPSFTKTAGVTKPFTVNQMVYQDFAFGSGYYENTWMISQWDSGGFNYGSDMLMGGTRINASLVASGSGTAAQKTAAFSVLDDTFNSGDGVADAVARYYGRTMELGLYNSEVIVVGNNLQNPVGYTTENLHLTAEDQVIIGSAQGTSYSYKGGTRAWDGTGKPTKDIKFYYTGSASFIQTGSATGPAVQITGSLNITGSGRNESTIVGNIKQSFPSPGNNNSVGLAELTGTNTINGKNYTNKNFFVADFNTFGESFRDYFSIEYYDGFAYNYGTEFNINGKKSRLGLVVSGSGTGRTGEIAVADNHDGTGQLNLLAGDQVDLNITAGNKGVTVTGAVLGTITTLGISSNTASLDFQDGDAYILNLVSGSDTHLTATNQFTTGCQTVSVRVNQPGTGHGTVSFSPDFKFAGGTAPTATATSNAEDILTFQVYAGTNVYGTAALNLS